MDKTAPTVLNFLNSIASVTSATEADKGHKLSLPGCRFHFVASTLSLPSCRFHVVALKIKGGLYLGTRTEISAGLWGSAIAFCYFCIFIFVSSSLLPPLPSSPSKLSLPRGRLQVVAFTFSRLTSCCTCTVRTCPLWAKKTFVRKVRKLNNTQPNLRYVSIMIIPFLISI